MKKYFIIASLLFFSIVASGQGNSGLGFNYQAVVKGADGFVLPKQSIELRFSLMPGQHAAQARWIETHSVVTDDHGTVAVTIGKGAKAGGEAAQFKDVNFAAIFFWMKVEIREGANFRELSYAALPSVPYAEVAANVSMPPGTIVPYGGETIPEGWLLCDGREISRSEYANLYNAIKTIWGHGNNSSTFNLPDMRGVFLRGVSDDSGKDEDVNDRVPLKEGGNSGNKVGSYQEDAIRNITANGGWWESHTTHNDQLTGAFYANDSGKFGSGSSDRDNQQMGFDASRVVPVGSDNRPKNVYVNYIIKY